MQMSQQISRTVQEIATIPITGNVIPQGWWTAITTADPPTDGKLHKPPRPYCLAIIILAEVVYWYRPAEIRDEETGQLIGFRQRFASDKLQRSYSSFADQFGVTKRQVKAAIARLVKLDLVEIEFRTIFVRGTAISNVLFLEPKPQKIRDLTPPITQQGSRYNTLVHHPPRYTATPPAPQRKTYTGITTRNSTIITTDVVAIGPAENPSIAGLMALIPATERSKKLVSIVAAAIETNGESYAQSNILFAIAHHKPDRGALGGLIIAALSEDLAFGDRNKASVLAESRRSADECRQRQEAADKKRIEELTETSLEWMKSTEGQEWIVRPGEDGLSIPNCKFGNL